MRRAIQEKTRQITQDQQESTESVQNTRCGITCFPQKSDLDGPLSWYARGLLKEVRSR